MQWHRLLTGLTGLAALGLSLCAYEGYIQYLGFPDGHITDLGAAEERLAVVFIVLSVILGSLLIFLSLVAGSRKARRALLLAVALYLLVLAGTVAVDHYYRSYLDDGIGG